MKALVVDGYNAIYRIPRLEKLMDRSLEEAREGITRLAKEYQRRRGGIDKVYVVFDGKDLHRENFPANPPHHVFSRTGEGDQEVVRVVRRLSKEYHVEVVTDDNFIRNNARAYNATAVKVSRFAAVADKRSGARAKKTGKEGAVKVDPRTASEINEELKRHWNIT